MRRRLTTFIPKRSKQPIPYPKSLSIGYLNGKNSCEKILKNDKLSIYFDERKERFDHNFQLKATRSFFMDSRHMFDNLKSPGGIQGFLEIASEKTWLQILNFCYYFCYSKLLDYPNSSYRFYDMDYFAGLGYLEVIKWFHTNMRQIFVCTRHTINSAAICNQLEVIKWIYNQKDLQIEPSEAIYYAAWSGHLSIIEWFYANRPQEFNNMKFTIEVAKKADRKDVIEWFKNNGFYETVEQN